MLPADNPTALTHETRLIQMGVRPYMRASVCQSMWWPVHGFLSVLHLVGIEAFPHLCQLKVDFVDLPVKNSPDVLKMHLLCKTIPGGSTLAVYTHFLPNCFMT